MKKNVFLLLLAAIPLFQSCSDDDTLPPPVVCDPFLDFGNFYMLESSHDFLPYTASNQKIIMVDSTGQEFEGTLSDYSFDLTPIVRLTPYPCEEDSTQSYQVRMNTETKYVTARFEQWDIKIIFRLSVGVTGDEPDNLVFTDNCNVALLRPGDASTPNSQIPITVNPRTNPFATLTEPSLSVLHLHGKTFYDVYTREIQNEDQVKIYYNREFGLTGLETMDKSISLACDRIE